MELNIAHSEFPEQQRGLMICGYEWGHDREDQAAEATGTAYQIDWDVECTFANKDLRYGPAILTKKYDLTIRRWFEMWGAKLNCERPGIFEKSIIQTNWCGSQSPNMDGDYERLNDPQEVDNFVAHVAHFRPRLIFLMGRQLIGALQNPTTLERFVQIIGPVQLDLRLEQKPFEGTRFVFGFQSFRDCEVVSLPHPSSSRGLANAYLEKFTPELSGILNSYRAAKEAEFEAA